jgi:radical SAM superfamily enzyme YgiQ (UPF0313 family)
MGGHYASFEPTEILKRTPGLDSVVRFDGEMTLVKLLHCLATGPDWRSLRGIAFRTTNREVSVAPLAQVVEDLDTLPCPDRSSIDYEGHPMPTASILGSRGCPWEFRAPRLRSKFRASVRKSRGDSYPTESGYSHTDR